MKVREFEHGLVLAQNAAGFERSPGLHMSDIYGALYKELDPDRYDKRGPDGTPEPMNLTKMDAGMGFEMRLEPVLEAAYGGYRPGELFTQHDEACPLHGTRVSDGALLCACGAGVAYSPDWLFTDPDPMVLGEFKFSWYSCKGFPHDVKFDKWMCQVKAYLYHLGLNTAWVFPYWVNGTYPKGAPSPQFEKAYEIAFSNRELKENWAMLVGFAKRKGMIP